MVCLDPPSFFFSSVFSVALRLCVESFAQMPLSVTRIVTVFDGFGSEEELLPHKVYIF